MATQSTKFKLNTGAEIPAIGFGTWQDAHAQEDAVTEALKAGYRHIDTARIYGTEPAVGTAIKKSGIPRGQLFITTKLWNNSHHPDDVERAIDASLKDLGTDYLDLYLMHWPSPFARSSEMMPKADGKIQTGDTDYVDTYKAMEKTLKSGKTKAIGISNFSLAEVERLLKETSVVPAAHQMELHPYLQQKDFVDFHKKQNIHITQYSPFGNQNEIYSSGKDLGKLIENPTILDVHFFPLIGMAEVDPRTDWKQSKTPSRIDSNLGGDFKLEQADIKTLDGMDKKIRFNDPSTNFGWNFYKDLDGKK
ncbi:hypothetical protein MMC06_001210 [Schaereria dolodes]|nr:hypothetical protein [Schaereria dolodes]